jgi:glycosyltransferase involved in cell wall biosynthesis
MNRENAIGITESATSYRGAVVVVPTRNRARIAMNAIRSVLDHPVGDIEVLVSDNSTSEEDREELASFCSTLADSRLRYLRPPASLAMPAHWDWAIEQALSFSSVSHFCYLTDRMMFKTGALQEVLNIAALYPERVISYNHDRIVDDAKPIRIEQYAGTEKLLEIQTLRLSYLFSQAIFHHALPRMLNCIVPRRVLERIRSRFGNVFSSIAPDFNFCCRCLELENSILFYDKSPIFHYALNRSNGASTTRGELTSDSADFIANLPVDNSFRNYATPIPQLITAVNAAFNEYLIFRQQTKSSRFFEVDRQKYLEANAAEIREVSDPALRADMTALLVEHGYNDLRQQAPANPLASTAGRSRSSSDSIWQKVKLTLAEAASAPERKRASIFGTTPPTELQLEFAEIEEAIDYAKNISQGNRSNSLVHTELLQARQLPLPERFPKG